jgi:23S rRNA (cytosine1962-C5)-methyltransferase
MTNTHARITLHSGKESAVLRGHPWVFPKAIAQEINCKTGHLVQVYDDQGQYCATGMYNEHSLYRVRILVRGEMMTSLQDCIHQRLQEALHLRSQLGLPNAETNAYRLFNSEADGLSGLTIDRFDTICVIASSAYWVEAHRPLIQQCLQDLLPNVTLLWSSQTKPLAQDGWHDSVSMPADITTQVHEAGIAFQVDFSNTQKTGLFLDQRDNHERIAKLVRNKRVLDLYTYSGGFALHAAKAGAAMVLGVDSSEKAITLAQHNAVLNHLHDNIHFVVADARKYLQQAGDYDVIILDPPKLVPSKRHIERAKNYYRYLHREIFKAMRPGSLLMTCNCSSALTTNAFVDLVSTQAFLEGKTAKILGVFGPALCHPTLAAFPEGQYLTAVLVAI